MFGLPSKTARQLLAVNTAASGANSVITLDAPGADNYNVIDRVWGSVASLATSPITLTITNCQGSGGALTFEIDTPLAVGFFDLNFGEGLLGLVNSAMVITFLDGTTAKQLNVQYR